MTTHARAGAEELAEKLTVRFGWLIGGSNLIRLLGYSSPAAFRQAAKRRRLPVRVFAIPGRRGSFAWAPDIAEWLVNIGAPHDHPLGQEDAMTNT